MTYKVGFSREDYYLFRGSRSIAVEIKDISSSKKRSNLCVTYTVGNEKIIGWWMVIVEKNNFMYIKSPSNWPSVDSINPS